jgi:hypothetical protein
VTAGDDVVVVVDDDDDDDRTFHIIGILVGGLTLVTISCTLIILLKQIQ